MSTLTNRSTTALLVVDMQRDVIGAASHDWSSPAHRPMHASARRCTARSLAVTTPGWSATPTPPKDMREWGSPLSPEQAIAYTNMYWSFSSAPGRTCATVDTKDVDFDAV
ncbi:MAG: hypothetical protein WA964_12525 [Ilumatobacter sp.]